MSTTPRQVHPGRPLPGRQQHHGLERPARGSQIDFASFDHLARTAERGRFDFLFLAEGLRLREQRGRIHDLDVVGRPDTLAVLAALAAVTDHIGLVGTLNATFNEPYELARQLATLDHLSDGRAGWNVVTSLRRVHTARTSAAAASSTTPTATTRAAEFVERSPRSSGTAGRADAVVADRATGRFLADDAIGPFAHRGPQFDVDGPVQRAAQPAGLPGDRAGRRLRRRPGLRRRARRGDLLPAQRARGRPQRSTAT